MRNLRVEITDLALRNLPAPAPGSAPLEIWDELCRELSIRLPPSGKFTEWKVRARLPDGRRVAPSLGGRWPAMSIRQARQKAKVVLGRIAEGTNPADTKRVARQAVKAERGAPSVANRLTEWQDARRAAWSDRYATEVARLCTKIIVPKLGAQPLAGCSREDWTSLVAGVRKDAPSTATWIYSTLSSFFGFAESHGWIAAHPLPRKGLVHIAPKAPARERTLNDTEVLAVWRAPEEFRAKPRLFVHLLVMTALREDEVAGLSVGEVDLMAGRITLPGARTKNRRPHRVPLHPLLISELQTIWPDRRAGTDYKLLGAIKGSAFAGFSGLKKRVDEKLPREMRAWRWHDLRRSARSAMSPLGVSPLHAEAALNHISGRSALERTYDTHDFADEAIAALQVWQAHVASLIAADGQVVVAEDEAA